MHKPQSDPPPCHFPQEHLKSPCLKPPVHPAKCDHLPAHSHTRHSDPPAPYRHFHSARSESLSDIWYKRCLRRYFLLEDWNYWHRSSVLKYKSQAPGTFHTELWKLFPTIRYLSGILPFLYFSLHPFCFLLSFSSRRLQCLGQLRQFRNHCLIPQKAHNLLLRIPHQLSFFPYFQLHCHSLSMIQTKSPWKKSVPIPEFYFFSSLFPPFIPVVSSVSSSGSCKNFFAENSPAATASSSAFSLGILISTLVP